MKNASKDPFAQVLHMALLVESWRSAGGMGLSPGGLSKKRSVRARNGQARMRKRVHRSTSSGTGADDERGS